MEQFWYVGFHICLMNKQKNVFVCPAAIECFYPVFNFKFYGAWQTYILTWRPPVVGWVSENTWPFQLSLNHRKTWIKILACEPIISTRAFCKTIFKQLPGHKIYSTIWNKRVSICPFVRSFVWYFVNSFTSGYNVALFIKSTICYRMCCVGDEMFTIPKIAVWYSIHLWCFEFGHCLRLMCPERSTKFNHIEYFYFTKFTWMKLKFWRPSVVIASNLDHHQLEFKLLVSGQKFGWESEKTLDRIAWSH